MATKICADCDGKGFCKACDGHAMVEGKECEACDGVGYCETCEGFGKVVDIEATDKKKEKTNEN